MNFLATFFIFRLFASEAFARGGGAGGFGDSGGGSVDFTGDGDLSLLFDLFFLLWRHTGFAGKLIILLVAAGVLWFKYKASEHSPKKVGTVTGFRRPKLDLRGLGDQDPQQLLEKVQIAFLTVQKCWSEQRLDSMRRFITDGIYQRFHAQFTMMKLLQQRNIVSQLQISDISIVKTSTEGAYECVDLRIQAKATDQFICERFPFLNTEPRQEEFAEFWSFIRRRNHRRGTDLFNVELCPQCSAPLNGKLVETARCPYCSAYLNSGEFDWVLSEITQASDYGLGLPTELKIPAAISKPSPAILAAFPTFSKQVLEDRTSNAFMQVLIAMATRNTQMLQRFTTHEAYEKLCAELPQGRVVYNRLFTRAVDMVALQVHGKVLKAFVRINYSAHQLILEKGFENFEGSHEPVSETKILVMIRELSTITAKGSVYANSCSSCGATQKDSLHLACVYCGTSLNNPTLDWIVADIIEMRQFMQQAQLFAAS